MPDAGFSGPIFTFFTGLAVRVTRLRVRTDSKVAAGFPRWKHEVLVMLNRRLSQGDLAGPTGFSSNKRKYEPHPFS